MILGKMKIGTRLMVGFGILLLLVLVLGLTALFGIKNLSSSMSSILENDAILADTSYMTLVAILKARRLEGEVLLNISNIKNLTGAKSNWDLEQMNLDQRFGDIDSILKRLARNDDLGLMKIAQESRDIYAKGFHSVYDLIAAGKIKDIDAASKAMEPYLGDARKLELIVLGFSNKNETAMQEAKDRSVAMSKKIAGGVMLVIFVMLGLGILFSLIISRSIRVPLKLLAGRLIDIGEGEGDLTVVIRQNSKDETGILASSFNKFVSKIKMVIKEVVEASHRLKAASTEMTSTATSLSENIQSQAASAEEISAMMDEVSGEVDSIALNANQQNDRLSNLIHKIGGLSDNIKEMENVVGDTLKLSADISSEAKSGEESVRLMTNSMSKITESSDKISGIISIINDISDKINLLSLNAAIEAARAGDAGRGFAVVADEISKLADQTSESIKEIDLLVRINSEETNAGINNVSNTNKTIGKTIEGVTSITSKMDEIFRFMRNQVTISSEVNMEAFLLKDLSDEIRVATIEQKKAFAEIMNSITSINELSQSNAASSEQLAGFAGNINQLSELLDLRVGFFKI
jgi:methyl-accepting chemotaxis protein